MYSFTAGSRTLQPAGDRRHPGLLLPIVLHILIDPRGLIMIPAGATSPEPSTRLGQLTVPLDEPPARGPQQFRNGRCPRMAMRATGSQRHG